MLVMLKSTLKKLNLSIFYYSLSNKNLEVVKMFCVILINRLTIIFMLIFGNYEKSQVHNPV